MTHLEYINYMQSLADNLNGLNDFFRIDLTEIRQGFRSGVQMPCMALESYEGDFSQSSIQQSVNIRTWAFTIFDNPANRDFNDQNQKLSGVEQLGLKILARMRKDSLTPGHILHNLFYVEDCRYSKVGPLFTEKLYGYRFVGQFLMHQPLTVNPEDWQDIDTVCS
ncbi:hypothetical protein CL622_07015 [archaeon]|nr:hypothetical protein [archaeon]|tara:strand:+ start:148 stop:642 length:495 start_codon:yes stop_codon:yes gene_type:complete